MHARHDQFTPIPLKEKHAVSKNVTVGPEDYILQPCNFEMLSYRYSCKNSKLRFSFAKCVLFKKQNKVCYYLGSTISALDWIRFLDEFHPIRKGTFKCINPSKNTLLSKRIFFNYYNSITTTLSTLSLLYLSYM